MPAQVQWSCAQCPSRGRSDDTTAASAAFQEHYAEHHLVHPTTPPTT